ncbi:MAG: winged helix-turn-helix transcriptional regulator [Acidilobaceae archaeon]|nr:winged helix-turn-helix transcriptional regulator [Acidilobaceae archaeon]MCX8164982.1 winged helix-turn-helix transcriptional regulator [Acidilobaceae archaeon]MDW7974501.1 winged helix-turn-helix transcriptional regulator [Sulfolobales archaeon]
MSFVLDSIRKVFGFRGEERNELDYDEIVTRLEMAKLEVDRIKGQLIDEIGKQYDRMINAAKSKDKDNLQLMASELVLKRKVLTTVIAYSKLLELAIRRINDARNIESIARALAPLTLVLKASDEYLSAVSPQIVASLTSVIELTSSVSKRVEATASYLPVANLGEIDAETKQEIARAMAEASRESEEIVKVPQVYQKDLEERVLNYVRSRGGHISISAAAKELGVTPAEVRKALEALENKGVIRVFRKQAEAT